MGNNRYQGPQGIGELPVCIDDGTLPLVPMPVCGPMEQEQTVRELDRAGKQSVDSILGSVDAVPELKGAGVILQFPNGNSYRLRQSQHTSELETVVVADIQFATTMSAPPRRERTWWEQWNGRVLNCGGAVVSWLGVGISAAAEIPSAGTSTILLVASYTSAVATTAQCGLSIVKEESDSFAEYVEGEDGQWINTADIILDVVSLAGGVAGAVKAVRSGSKVLQASKYSKHLNKLRKGKLLKYLERLRTAEEKLDYFEDVLQRALKLKAAVVNPAGKQVLTNNVLKRALPHVIKQLRSETLSGLADVVAASMTTWSSYYGGAGSKELGLVKVSIQVFQESIFRDDSNPEAEKQTPADKGN